MGSRRLLASIAASVTLLVMATGVATAAGATTTTERIIRDLGRELLYVAVPVTLITEGFLFYAIWKFRKNDEPAATSENTRLEVAWTVATALILLFVGTTAYTAMAHPSVTPTENDVERELQQESTVVVNVTGVQWYWKITYPEHDVTTRNTMVLPADRQVVFRIRSADVIHSVFVPELGLKKDAVPGYTTYLVTRTTEGSAGETYRLYCAEYCGAGHSDMTAQVRIVPPERYQQWLDDRRSERASSTPS